MSAYYQPSYQTNKSAWVSVGMIIGVILVSIYFLSMLVSSINTAYNNLTNYINSLNLPITQYSDAYITILNNTANNLQNTYNTIEPYAVNPYFIIFLIGLGLIVSSLSDYIYTQYR